MQAMPSIVEADRRCHHASGDAQMDRLFPDDALVRRLVENHPSRSFGGANWSKFPLSSTRPRCGDCHDKSETWSMFCV